jgi:site-specific DNA-methyltransferase (adenine-specific)
MKAQVHLGDSREVLETFEPDSIDGVATDPPYALESIVQRFGGENAAPASSDRAYKRMSAGFMGQAWDTGETAFSADFWHQVLRVTKPGGWCVAFSHARTYHRLATAMEAAGWEIRDQVLWLYGSGFPKSKDMPLAFESRLCVRVPVVDAKGAPVMGGNGKPKTEWRYADDAEPIRREPPYRHPLANEWAGWGTALKPAHEPAVLARKPVSPGLSVAENVERWRTGALNIEACRVGDEPMAAAVRGVTRLGTFEGADGNVTPERLGRYPSNVVLADDGPQGVFPRSDSTPYVAHDPGAAIFGGGIGERSAGGYSDSGSASRFFYSAKAGPDDRLGTEHPTVKPVGLMRYATRLVTPPGGTVLDPFAGSGTTGMAALREGFVPVLIERDPKYHADIQAKLRHVSGMDTPLFSGS